MKTVDLKGFVHLVDFSCPACTAETVVKTDGVNSDARILEATGPVEGRYLTNLSSDIKPVTLLQVNADAPWTLKIRPVSALAKNHGPVSGKGSDVVWLEGDTNAAKITHTGAGYFGVWTHSLSNDGTAMEGTDLAVNQSGPYSGMVIAKTPVIFAITADSAWSIEPR